MNGIGRGGDDASESPLRQADPTWQGAHEADTPRIARTARIAVLASGGGSNLGALLDHLAATPAAAAQVVFVASNSASAGALERAKLATIAHGVIADHSDGDALLAQLNDHRPDVLVLAGYLKQVPARVVRAYEGRMLNVHPALLPSFGGAGMYGQRVHSAVIASGARVSGATVHFVSDEYDCGAIIAQWPVPVRDTDTPATLAARVLEAEHWLYPRCIAAVATGSIRLDADGRARGMPDSLRWQARAEAHDTRALDDAGSER